MMEFGSPYFLLLLVLLVPLGLRLLYRPVHRKAAIQFSSLRILSDVSPGRNIRLRRLLPALRLLALALLIIGLARPRYGTVERDIQREGVDIFYCLDISGSMLAEDFTPNRLEKAKQLTADFASRRPNDRQGISIFAGTSVVLCPLTFDSSAVQEFLKGVQFKDIEVDGTAIGLGLARALKKMQRSGDSRDRVAKSKVIILMTDGVNNAGDINPMQAASLAKKMGVRIYTIGIGSEGVAYITVDTPFGPQRQRLEDSLDEKLLQQIASETGGTYSRATSDSELEMILSQIDKMEKTDVEMKEYHSYEERMGWFCWPALLLLMLEILLANTFFIKIP